jgi:transposase
MSDEEWAVFSPFLTENRGRGGRPPRDHRRNLDGIFWVARTGAPWRDLPEEFGLWGSVYRQFRRWTLSGVWEVMLGALADADPDAAVLQMIDSTTVRAHHCAAGAKGGLIARVLAVLVVASRPSSTPTRTRMASRSAC